MQTFLPYSSFKKSAQCLDYKRLGKQRVEAFQILNALAGKSKGWVNHPATLMWRGYEKALCLYHNVMIREWVDRGYRNSMSFYAIAGKVVMPWWLGFEALHASHRSKLLHKDAEYYGQFRWSEGPDLPYWWPVEPVTPEKGKEHALR